MNEYAVIFTRRLINEKKINPPNQCIHSGDKED